MHWLRSGWFLWFDGRMRVLYSGEEVKTEWCAWSDSHYAVSGQCSGKETIVCVCVSDCACNLYSAPLSSFFISSHTFSLCDCLVYNLFGSRSQNLAESSLLSLEQFVQKWNFITYSYHIIPSKSHDFFYPAKHKRRYLEYCLSFSFPLWNLPATFPIHSFCDLLVNKINA